MDIGTPGAGSSPSPRPNVPSGAVRGPGREAPPASSEPGIAPPPRPASPEGGAVAVRALLETIGLPRTDLREAIVSVLRDAELPLKRDWIGRTEHLARKLNAADEGSLRALVDLLARRLPVTPETLRANRHLLADETGWARRWGQAGRELDPDRPDETVGRWLSTGLPVEARLASLDSDDPAPPPPGEAPPDALPEEPSARLASGLRALGTPPQLDVPWADRDGNQGWVRIQDEARDAVEAERPPATRVRMSLETPHLSRLGIDLHFVAGQVTLQIDLIAPELARWLEPRLQELRTALEARGLTVIGPGIRVRRENSGSGDASPTRWG
ncbi:MAG: flagellar hook-length control protein FliK [bacterium]|nr:flagellar hook-length control protein FliK [bacterium]